VLPPTLSAADASVFVNVGANWFTSTRQGTAYDGKSHFSFKGTDNGSFKANNKIYLQGDKSLISEAGEWALDHHAGMLYYWPRDQQAMASGAAEVVITTTKRVFDFAGTDWAGGLATAIDVAGIVVSGSDFASEYRLFNRPNDTPFAMREGMVRFENASDVTFTDSALLDAGFSAFWFQGFAQHITVAGNRIDRPGFCGAYLQGIYPGDTTATQQGAIAGGAIDTVAKSDLNFGHTISNNAVYDYGKRVGHGSGFWFFQAGNTTVAHNLIVEGPRDAFGVYGVRFGCFTRYGVNARCAEDPADENMLYGEPCDWWCGLRALHTRWVPCPIAPALV
jgi:hypothetical protein